MPEAVTRIDKAGRVVIPKEMRDRIGLKEDTAVLVTDVDSVVVMKKLDIAELGRRLRQELKGVDVEEIAARVEEESNEQARRERKPLRR
jgi:AbrB family looped-hinge helix DNA binding protein